MKRNNLKFAVALAMALLFNICSAKNNTSAPDTATVIATTKLGKLRGGSENSVKVWRGIRYAKAPVGNLRFKNPVPVEPWAGVKDALEFGAAAPQIKNPLNNELAQNEDCLFLNIWSPAADGKKRPVMFWIHGGGFAIGSGSSPIYNGSNIAKNGDVVVVTINYRLGPLGFLYFNNIAPGNNDFENNLGIRDQIAALKWVKENIAAFGGDPDQVTIFGESAGGTSVEVLLAAHDAKGLYRRAIVESGPPAILFTPAMATELTKKFLAFAGIKPDSLQLLKKLPVDSIKSAEEKLLKFMVADYDKAKVLAPTIDGQLLTKDIFSSVCKEQCDKVDLMIGTNKNEANLFARKKLGMVPRDTEGLDKYFTVLSSEDKKRVTAVYKGYPHKSGILSLVTDAVFRIPSLRLAEQQMNIAPVYVYRFEWASPILKMAGAGSFHGLEIPFVFANVDSGMGKILKLIATKKLITRLSGQMQTAWINFARYGNPNGKGPDAWKMYDADKRVTMIFNKKTKPVSDPDARQRKAWEGVKYY
jgi:para-nitrobenzyl esterase